MTSRSPKDQQVKWKLTVPNIKNGKAVSKVLVWVGKVKDKKAFHACQAKRLGLHFMKKSSNCRKGPRRQYYGGAHKGSRAGCILDIRAGENSGTSHWTGKPKVGHP